MNPWFGKAMFLVGIASTVIIRAPHGGRSRKVAVVESRKGPARDCAARAHVDYWDDSSFSGNLHAVSFVCGLPTASRSQWEPWSYVSELGSFIARTRISVRTGPSVWRYVKITSWSRRGSIVSFDTQCTRRYS